MIFKNIKLIVGILILGLTMSSCHKDDIQTNDASISVIENSITGFVQYDNDGDGIPDEPGVRIPVFLIDSIHLGLQPSEIDTLITIQGEASGILVTETNDLGFYEFNSIEPFDSKFLMSGPLYTTAIIQGSDITSDGDTDEEILNTLIPVSLDDGELDDGNNFIVSYLPQSISGSVLLDTDGDEVGDTPLNGFIVSLYHRENGVATQSIDSRSSSSDGSYEFLGIPEGEYILQMFPLTIYDHVSSMDITPDPDGVGDPSNPTSIPVDLIAGEKDEDNIFLVKPLEVNISGQVLVDNDGDLIGDAPVPNHRIELYLRTPNGVPTGALVDATNSNNDGEFQFSQLDPGEYVLYHIGDGVTPVGFNQLIGFDLSPEVNEPISNPDGFFIAVNIPTEDFCDKDNLFLFSQSQTFINLEGSIFEDITSDGQPDLLTDMIINVELYQRDGNGFQTGPALFTTTSNADGTYSFENLPAGEYILTLNESSNNFSTIFGSSTTPGPQPLPDKVPITIFFGSIPTDSYFWIYTFDNTPSINGTVFLDTDGDGIQDDYSFDHTIELYQRGADGLPEGNLIYLTNSTGQGQFNFTNLSTGNYVLKLTGPAEYTCLTSGDDSPENGEALSNNGCTYIAVDFNEGIQDIDNNYLVQRQ